MNTQKTNQVSTEHALTIPVVMCSVLSKDGSYIKFECSDFSGKSLSKVNFNIVIEWLNKEKEKYPDVF